MSTALIPLAPIDRQIPAASACGRPRAEFLAQLIAASGQAPQTRLRRRAEPGEAIAAYGALGRRPKPLGNALTRSL